MTKKIIYTNADGGLSIVTPTGDLAVEEIARKDVPAGSPYKIIDASDVPSDRTFRAAWEADLSVPDGIGIGAPAWFIEKYKQELIAIGAEAPPSPPEVIVPKAINELEVPEGTTISELETIYAQYLESVKIQNQEQELRYKKAVSAWEADKANRMAELEQKIAVQEQEMAA